VQQDRQARGGGGGGGGEMKIIADQM